VLALRRSGGLVRLALLVAGLPTPDHAWDFRAGRQLVSGALSAQLREGARCDAEGVVLEGGYVEIDPWEWGGPVTFEAKVRYNSYANQAAVFALGVQDAEGRICDLYSIMSYTMLVVRRSAVSFSRVITEDHEVVLSEWCHVVATCQAGELALYMNGQPAGTAEESAEAKTLLRRAYLGRALQGGNLLDGTIAYFRVWHQVVLPPEMIQLLYQQSL
ncbi:unnamed protein product, partial [Effrenium voratum]